MVEQGIVGLLASLAEVRRVLVAVAGVVLAEAPKAAVALSDEVKTCGGRKVQECVARSQPVNILLATLTLSIVRH